MQTGLGLVVGVTGPLALNVLTKQLKSKDSIIATSSLFMTISHLTKIPVYLTVTASLLTDLNLIIDMIIGAVWGSFLGTRLRLRSNNERMIQIIKVLLSLFAVKMIVQGVI
ncbi:TSUP family transporter [Vibrio spartinae]|uniref:Probable membrane transporter protein n=1 Tax=Vibrio spartinae TaxID=1918945 RepID=A0ABX6R620_9VIBR|nr:TSUP family transporter [Vibrio spartinae]QMV16772.1 Sulfite exporter TauE/SafE [Vibrio spartinae]